jgi:hypothetical protein
MAKVVKKKAAKKASKKTVAKKATPKKKAAKKVVAKAKPESKPQVDPNTKDIEAGIEASKRNFLTPSDRDKAVRLLYERSLAEKNTHIKEQEVRNIKLELRLMEEVNLANAEQQLERDHAAYQGANTKVREFMDTLKEKYGVSTQDLKFNPASGKIIR